MMRKSVPYFVVMSILLFVTTVVALWTKAPYGNSFFTNTKEIIISFLAFLLIDAIRWTTRILGNAENQKKGQEIGWTSAFLLFVVYFLWRYWDQYSFWQGWLITTICVISLIGLVVRLCNKWNADCVRWATWSICCFAVTCSILGCIIFWKPITLKEAEERILAETGDDRFTFQYIDNGATMINPYAAEAPLGYYIFSLKQEDGGSGSYETGCAVVYLGATPEGDLTPDPEDSPTNTCP